MKTIFQIVQEKEEQIRLLQAQVEKLRAAADIMSQEGALPPSAGPIAPEPPSTVSVRPPASRPAAEAPAPGRKVWP